MIKLTKLQYLKYQEKAAGTSNRRRLASETNELSDVQTSNTMNEQQSGGTFEDMYFALADKYNNVVVNDNTAKLTVRVDTTK